MPDDYKKLILQYLKAVSGKEKSESLLRQYIEDESLVQHSLEMEYAFPRYEIKVEDALAVDNKVVIRGMLYATHAGDLMGIPPTGVKVSLKGK
jgi:predicted ester cyclase